MPTIIKAGGTSESLSLAPASDGILELRSGLATGGVVGMTMDASQNVTMTATSRTAGYLVASLPAPGTVGRRAYVTNALAPTAMSTVVGGGAVSVPVFDNGINWIVG